MFEMVTWIVGSHERRGVNARLVSHFADQQFEGRWYSGTSPSYLTLTHRNPLRRDVTQSRARAASVSAYR